MIVDSSAALAVLYGEIDAAWFAERLARSGAKRMSAANSLECAINFDSAAPGMEAELDAFLVEAGVEVVAVTPAQARIARTAYRRFGRGRHPAALNFGDCFAYALASDTGEPLLFKEGDFVRTDVTPVL